MAEPEKARTRDKDKNQLAGAKSRIMAEVPYVQNVPKGETDLKYSFLSEADLIRKLQPAMVKEGLVLSPIKMELLRHETYKTSRNATMNLRIVKVTYRMTHAASGESEEIEALGEGADIGDKATPKAMTNAFKYALRQGFMIETGDDPDFTPSDSQERGNGNGGRDDRREQDSRDRDDRDRDDRGSDRDRRDSRDDGRREENSRGGHEPARRDGDGPRDAGNQDDRSGSGAGPDSRSAPPPTAGPDDKFKKRLEGMRSAGKIATLDEFRKIYSADQTMTSQMMSELEGLYWRRKGEIEAHSRPA